LSNEDSSSTHLGSSSRRNKIPPHRTASGPGKLYEKEKRTPCMPQQVARVTASRFSSSAQLCVKNGQAGLCSLSSVCTGQAPALCMLGSAGFRDRQEARDTSASTGLAHPRCESNQPVWRAWLGFGGSVPRMDAAFSLAAAHSHRSAGLGFPRITSSLRIHFERIFVAVKEN
jgi:hypothetical protein